MISKKRSLLSKSAILSVLAGAFMFNAPAQAETIYMVQLGSFENEDKARERWDQLSNKFPDLFSPLSFKRKEIKLPSDDFVYHRAQAGPIKSRSDAEAICDDLLISGFECFIAETALFEPTLEPVKTAAATPTKVVEKAVEKVAVAPAAVAAPKPTAKPVAAVQNPAFPPLPDAFDALDAKPAVAAAPAPVVVEKTAAQKAIQNAKESLRPSNVTLPPVPSLSAAPKAEIADVNTSLDKEVAAFKKEASAPTIEAPTLATPKVVMPTPNMPLPPVAPTFSMTSAEPAIDLPAPPRSAEPIVSRVDVFKPTPNLDANVPAPSPVVAQKATSDVPAFIKRKQNEADMQSLGDSSLPTFVRGKTPSNGSPFEVGQSTDHLRPTKAIGADGEVRLDVPELKDDIYTAVAPSAPVVVDNIKLPTAASSSTNRVQFAEAVRVPLVDVPEVKKQRLRAPSISHFKGYPSASLKSSSLWAEMSYFTNQKAALGYWSVLQKRDAQLPQGVRLRVTRPFMSKVSQDRVSLRVGPFKNVSVVKRLCSHTRAEKLMCRAVKDLGSSIANRSTGPRERYNKSERHAMLKTRNLQGFWLQLGSFSSIRDAQASWVDMKETYPKQLSALKEDILTPRRSSVKGNSYRLRAGPFADSTSAVSACERLKRHGGLCLVVADK